MRHCRACGEESMTYDDEPTLGEEGGGAHTDGLLELGRIFVRVVALRVPNKHRLSRRATANSEGVAFLNTG